MRKSEVGNGWDRESEIFQYGMRTIKFSEYGTKKRNNYVTAGESRHKPANPTINGVHIKTKRYRWFFEFSHLL